MSEVAGWDGPLTYASQREVWHVECALGAGGAGRTCLVRRGSAPADDPERFVLKELHLEALEDWKQVELFERELQVMRALEHPGIPRVVDVVHDDDGRPRALVQTRVVGRTLRELLDEGGPLDAARFERTLRDVLEILAFLHGHVPPIVHRDISPRNVMIDDARAWLIDFGAVRWAQRESTQLTSVGTFGYMPPEQILGRAVPASDLYALGVTLVEVATGCAPGELPTDSASGALDTATALSTVPSLPHRIRDVLVAMTRPGLGERLGDPADALRRLDAPQPQIAASAASSAPAAADAARPRASKALLAFAAMALLAGLGFVFMSRGTSSSAVDHQQAEAAAEPVPVVAAPEVPSALPKPPPDPIPMPQVQPPPVPEPSPRVEARPTELTDANSAELQVTSTPTGATVSLSGEVLGVTPLTVRLPYGKHTLELTRDAQTVRREVNVLGASKLGVRF